jgi:hypothetical protein
MNPGKNKRAHVFGRKSVSPVIQPTAVRTLSDAVQFGKTIIGRK